MTALLSATPVRLRALGPLIFALGLLARLAWIAMLPGTLTWDDERQFAEVARHLAAGDGYVSDSYRATPVLPIFLALVFRLFGENYLIARLGQSLLGAATCVILCWLGTRLGGPAAGALAGAGLALYPPHVYLAGVFYAEALGTFFLVGSIALSVRAVERKGSPAAALLTGACLGVSALTRPIFLACVPAVAASWLVGGRPSGRRRVALCLVMLLGSAATILPWTMRNYRTYGRALLVSSGFYTKLWQGNNELSDGGPDDRELHWGSEDWGRRLSRLDEPSRRAVEARYAAVDAAYRDRLGVVQDRYLASDAVLKDVVLHDIRAKPLRTLSLMAKKVVTLYSAFSTTLTENPHTTGPFKRLAALSFYPLLLLAVVGLVWGAADRRALAPLYAVVAFVTGAYALLNTCTRFRLPLDPLLLVFASLAVVRIGRWFEGRGSAPETGGSRVSRASQGAPC